MVFSSTGDITRSKNSAGQNAASILVRRKLLNSTTAVALQSGFLTLFPSDCRQSDTPLGKVSLLPADLGSVDGIDGIASETLTRGQRAENIRGAFELAHLNQAAASSVLSTGRDASELARVFGKAGARPVWVGTVARKLRNHAVDFEAEPEEESLVQAQ